MNTTAVNSTLVVEGVPVSLPAEVKAFLVTTFGTDVEIVLRKAPH